MNQKYFWLFVFAILLSACTVLDDYTVSESYPITFHPAEEAYIDSYLESLNDY